VLSGHKQIEFVVAMLGCLRLGVTYVPLDSINPPQRLQRIIELVGAGHCYDAEQDQFRAGAACAAPLAEAGLAYIMFTSGSTGDPKGVQIGRDSLALFAGWIRDCLALGEQPRFMNQMLFSFDFSLFDLWGRWPWVASVLCPREVIGDPEGFVDYRQPGAGMGLDAVLRASAVAQRRLRRQHLPALQVFVFGAESLTPTLANQLWQRFPRRASSIPTAPPKPPAPPPGSRSCRRWNQVPSRCRSAGPSPMPSVPRRRRAVHCR
jgi:D-alanine--poly(phosphoribitol) ligase subunit 1